MLKALQHPDIKRVHTLEGFIPGNGALSPAEITKKFVDEIESDRRLAARIGLNPE